MGKKKTTKGTKRTVVIYLLILAVLFVAIYVVPQVSDIFVETYSAEYGTLQIKEESKCLFVRTEKTYTTPAAGTVNRVISRGKLMRSGARIMDVGPTAYYSDVRGIVSYYYDGLEEAYTPETMENLGSTTLSRIQESTENKVQEAPKDTAAAGDVIFKIVDNRQWYLVCWVGSETADRYVEGSVVTVDFADGTGSRESTCIKMDIFQVKPQGGQTRVILSCDRYYGDYDRYRVKNCVLITSNISGILLETDSIVEEDGQKGVYVVDKLGNYSFTPVRVLNQDGNVTVVEKNYFYDAEGKMIETVSNYDEILRPEAESEAEKDADTEDQADKEE